MFDVAIVGGGLSGLISSILLSRAGLKVTLFEKKKYPFHRVCGEYVSNEVIPFLENHHLFPHHLNPTSINTLFLSAVSGNYFEMPLDLGGFGISRYHYDHWLVDQALASGVEVLEESTVEHVRFTGQFFEVENGNSSPVLANLVIGAHGKRSMLDKNLSRDFLKRKSPYVGVKYHLKSTTLPDHVIHLHNFKSGYCGISKVEGDRFNLCYLIHRDQLRKSGSIEACERDILSQNPHLKQVFNTSEFLFERPEVINEITFENKESVHNHLLMAGDSAGMITPLCGNGMAMAMRSAKILSEILVKNYQTSSPNLSLIEAQYRANWQAAFSTRLWAGRQIQKLFGSGHASSTGVFIGKNFKPVARFLIEQTHGTPFY